MTEKEKMLAGKLYDTFEDEEEKRTAILRELLPNMGENGCVAGPAYFDYGVFTHIGKRFYANFNFTVLDVCPVTIGDDVMIGPNVSIMTPVHPLRYQDRNMRRRESGELYDLEYGKPIIIGNNCWIASCVTITGGVTIGNGCVIGAGSVVTRDIPDNCFAAGNPCRVIRKITEKDAVALKSELF